MAGTVSGLHAKVERLGRELDALQKAVEVEKLGQQLEGLQKHMQAERLDQQLEGLQTTMDKVRDSISELRKDGISQVDDASTTECDDLDGWEVPGASIADQMEPADAEKRVIVKVKDAKKTERAVTMNRLRSLAPKVKGCMHAAQMLTVYGNQHGRGIKCNKCDLKVFEKNSQGDAETVVVVTMP